LADNRGKHPVTVEIGTPEEQLLVRELVAKGDTLVENF
jgi:crotonobetainyl-CoA:carnitine CoA-transferase CaiB-like acyl-CoA transferase